MDRRTFLHRSAMLAATSWVAGAWAPDAAGAAGAAGAAERTLVTSAAPDATTLARTLTAGEGEGWVRFSEGPGWPIEVRAELAEPRRGRDDRRTALATVVHLTDIHVVDGQSPSRVEFTDRLEDPAELNPGLLSSAHRPQETLCGQVADAMVRALREVGVGPVTGRAFDCAVSTGDNTDNQQENEVEWFVSLLDGGTPVELNSGHPDRYEGIQDDHRLTYDRSFYHPQPDPVPDDYKRVHGFPDRPGLLDAVIAPFTPAGLPCPWYSVHGNHDGLVQGNVPALEALQLVSVGPLKVVGLPHGLSQAAAERALLEGDAEALFGGALSHLADGDLEGATAIAQAPVRLVAPDERRRFLSRAEYAAKHFERTDGPGPVGHGLDDDAPETGRLYYTFEISEHVVGISLDSVNPGGWATGSLDRPQRDWLEQRLIELHARYHAADGSEVATDHGDRLVLVFAHHNLSTFDNVLPDWTTPDLGPRVLADELEALLHRFPNVLGFVNGHSHVNRVTPFPDPAGHTDGFWEISTAAHIDHPQQSRIIEIVDNSDGTLSLLSTIVDHAGPARAPDEPSSVLDLASFSRELALNDPQVDLTRDGGPGDRNAELLLTAPFEPVSSPPDEPEDEQRRERADDGAEIDEDEPDDEVDDAEPTPAASGSQRRTRSPRVERVESRAPAPTPTPAGAPEHPLPTTGSATLGVGAILLAGALALRRRGGDGDDVAF